MPALILLVLSFVSAVKGCSVTKSIFQLSLPQRIDCPISPNLDTRQISINSSCHAILEELNTTQDINYYLDFLFDSLISNPMLRKSNVQAFVFVCCEGFDSTFSNCTHSFIRHCLERNDTKKLSSCINYMYKFCYDRSGSERPSCRKRIEDVINDIFENSCDSMSCEDFLSGILGDKTFHQFNSVKRVVSLLRGHSRKAGNPYHKRKFLRQTKEVIDLFQSDIANSSSMIDDEDAQNLLEAMNDAFGSNRVSKFSQSNESDDGLELLKRLKWFNKIFGRAILSGMGRIRSRFNFFGSNLDVKFRIANESKAMFEHVSESGDKSVVIELPKNALCPPSLSSSQQNTATNENNSNSTATDNEEDLPDKYRNCFPVNFSPGCRQVLASHHAHGIERSFEEVSNSTLVSLIASVQVVTNDTEDITGSVQLLANITLLFNISELNSTSDEPVCHYWNASSQNWSTDGVTTERLSSSQVLCTSNHLTSFAVLVDHTGTTGDSPGSVESLALDVISYTGASISIICLIITIVLLIVLRKQLQKGPLFYVHINLSFALLLALLIFVFGIDLPKSITWLCSVVAGLLHYLFLCVFCWSLAEGIMLYILIVKVYGSLADKWYLLLPLGWGVPIIIVGVAAGINYELYGTENYCWLSSDKGMIWSFIGPMLLIIIINSIFLLVTLFHIIRSRMSGGAEYNLKNIDFVKSSLKGVVVLLPLLSITWIIGLFTFNDQTKVFHWIFAICNSLQGLAILYFHVLRNKNISNWFKGKLLYRNKCKSKAKEFATASTNNIL